MSKDEPRYSFARHAAVKAASRARDEELLRSGEITPGELARINGGGVRGAVYVGPSERIRTLAESWSDQKG